MSVVAAAAFLAVAMNSPVAVAASKQMVEGQADSNNMTPKIAWMNLALLKLVIQAKGL